MTVMPFATCCEEERKSLLVHFPNLRQKQNLTSKTKRNQPNKTGRHLKTSYSLPSPAVAPFVVTQMSVHFKEHNFITEGEHTE